MASYEKNVAETNVSKWLEFKKAIKTHQKKINELKSAQKLVENLIISSMKSNDIPQYKLQSGGSLELVTKFADINFLSLKFFCQSILKIQIRS